MNRAGIEDRTRELATSPANPEKDWRPLALLILGLGLLAAPLIAADRVPWTGSGQGRGANANPDLTLLAGSDISDPSRLDSLLFRPIRVNLADAELLSTINGIGPQLAARIVARRREKGCFRQPADLLEVSGIGQAKLKQLQKYLSFN